MSTQDIQKLSAVVRSIDIIEEKTNTLNAQYTESLNQNLTPIILDDSNIHLQIFFQHFEQLLQTDLKNRKSLLNANNNKRSYWNFLSVALKESKALYDTVLYVLNSQEVKSPMGRGRLFIRYCLQNHRLGDVIQHSFMSTKVVNQFYNDECFWTTPRYWNRIIQALYQLTELQFDLLSDSKYQLDISWPIPESIEYRPKTSSDASSRHRQSSVSSFVSMNSIDPHSIISVAPDISNAIAITSPADTNATPSVNDDSLAQSFSSVDEDPQNTLVYWKQKCKELEVQLQEKPVAKSSSPHDVEIQCLMIEDNPNDDSNQILDELKTENDELRTQINLLTEEISNLNLKVSSVSSQRSTNIEQRNDYENDMAKYKSLIEEKETLLNELKQKYEEQTEHLQIMKEQHLSSTNEQNEKIEFLTLEIENLSKLLENERMSIENERTNHEQIQEKLEVALHEKNLDFEEMKRRLVKAVREKADLFNTLHSYEIKLEEELSKQWMLDEEVLNCMKCNTGFGWTVRKHHCRRCHKIFCHYCSNNWVQSGKPNVSPYRVCDYCNDKILKESLMPNGIIHNGILENHEIVDDVDTRFEVRPERLTTAADTQPPS